MNILVFSINNKLYGMDILKIIEVERMRDIISVPDSADFAEGVISLHGKIIPIVNLKKKFRMDNAGLTKTEKIIISKVKDCTVGILVDSVHEVIKLERADLTSPDDMLNERDYLMGVVKKSDKLILVIDIDRALGDEGKGDIEAVKGKVKVIKKRQE